MNIHLQADEKIIRNSKANLISLFGSKGGNLTLTSNRLIFAAHALNIGSSGLSIERKDILGFSKAFAWPKLLFIPLPIPIPNAIKFTTNSGKNYKFVVSGRKDWVSVLTNELR